MKLQDQVCNLELSSELRRLKVEQYSLFHWCKRDEKSPYDEWEIVNLEQNENKKYPLRFTKKYSAFTVAELGEMLKGKCALPFYDSQFRDWRVIQDTRFIIGTSDSNGELTEVNCRAKMLIYLLENKLIKAK